MALSGAENEALEMALEKFEAYPDDKRAQLAQLLGTPQVNTADSCEVEEYQSLVIGIENLMRKRILGAPTCISYDDENEPSSNSGYDGDDESPNMKLSEISEDRFRKKKVIP
ncbi:MAG TPA: hypothetical protein PLD88_06000 [Candidatus Berkiella sp.]|nr:hypothetical protein [Candidatus Berkiella sp.]